MVIGLIAAEVVPVAVPVPPSVAMRSPFIVLTTCVLSLITSVVLPVCKVKPGLLIPSVDVGF